MTSATPRLTVLSGFLPQFKIGAIVHLKSGGPDLTVTSVEDNFAEVHWFEGGNARQKILPVAALILSRKHDG
jgi:uncharacterized protein YodC (DUF2158 family)